MGRAGLYGLERRRDCFPLYQRLENNDAPGDHHGRAGPVTLRTVPPNDPCGGALLAACAAGGHPHHPVQHRRDGGARRQLVPDQRRARTAPVRSASVAYLHPILGKRPNLDVRTGLQAKRLLLDADRRCIGVEYLEPDLIHTRTVTARREVIVSCGAIDTPKLLMLSGIGPAGPSARVRCRGRSWTPPASARTSRTTRRA